MRQVFAWSMRILFLTLAVLILVGFAHYSGLRKYKYNTNKINTAPYKLTLHTMQPISNKRNATADCETLKAKTYDITVQRNNNSKAIPLKMIITISHRLAGATYFSGTVYLPTIQAGQKKILKFKTKALSWSGGNFNGSGLISTGNCRGSFSLHQDNITEK